MSRAVQGDHAALTTLLYKEYERLLRLIRRGLPRELQSVLDPEDVLQVAFGKAFRDIRTFTDRSDGSFSGWLTAITQHTLLDEVDTYRRQKRGGQWKQVHPPTSWVAAVVRWEHTPSDSFSRKELERAIEAALPGLKDDYREALRLRDLEELPVAEIARRMGRTEAAVHQLCTRARKQLRDALVSASRYLRRR